MRDLFFKFLFLAALQLNSSFMMSAAVAEEDDGTPYNSLAKLIGPEQDVSVADVMNYGLYGGKKIRAHFEEIDRAAQANGHRESDNLACTSFNDVSNSGGVIDIRYALGYFDDSNGHSTQYANRDWGKSVSSDEGVAIAVREFLTEECPNADRRLCGFTEKRSAAERVRNGETLLTRQLEVQGRSVEVRITLTYASASPFYERNLGALKSKQERYTRTSEENFFGGLRSADYVFYVGHSRNGGGPDFNPPRLLAATGKPDYLGYYRKFFPGRNRMMQELAKTSNGNVTVGLFSCESNLHFRSRLLGQNPKQPAILTIGTTGSLDYFDVLRGSLGYLEGILRGTCGARLEDFARPTAKDRAAFQQYNMK